MLAIKQRAHPCSRGRLLELRMALAERVEENEQVEKGGEEEDEDEKELFGCFLPFVACWPLK